MNTNLLIVDDEAAICLLLKDWLTGSGFNCQTALSGAEALEILAVYEIDAIISDLKMPGMSGLDLLAKVRESYPHTAFLMATGVGDIRLAVHAMKLGRGRLSPQTLPTRSGNGQCYPWPGSAPT